MAMRTGSNRKKEMTGPISAQTEACNQAAQRAYWVAAVGLLPLVGLVFGPLAIVLGILARRQAKDNPEFTLWGPVWAAIYFGLAITLCNWLGFPLIYLGLQKLGVL
jgi:hypothetical protein